MKEKSIEERYERLKSNLRWLIEDMESWIETLRILINDDFADSIDQAVDELRKRRGVEMTSKNDRWSFCPLIGDKCRSDCMFLNDVTCLLVKFMEGR